MNIHIGDFEFFSRQFSAATSMLRLSCNSYKLESLLQYRTNYCAQSLNVSLLCVLGMTRYDPKIENWRGCIFEKHEFCSSGIHYNSLFFPDIFPLHFGPVEGFGASQGAFIAYPIGMFFPARIGVSCGLRKAATYYRPGCFLCQILSPA